MTWKTSSWLFAVALAGLAVLVVGGAEAQTSEANPLRDDGNDGGGDFADVESVWISADDGASEFEISWRIEFASLGMASPSTAKENPYLVYFTHGPTGVDYAVAASLTTGPTYGTSGLFYEYSYFVRGDDDGWCRLGELPDADFVDTDGDGVFDLFVFPVEYDMLNIATAPPITYWGNALLDGAMNAYTSCGTDGEDFTRGPPAAAGDLLEDWGGGAFWQYGGGAGKSPVGSCPACGDEIDGSIDQDYTLGGGGGPTIPTPPNATFQVEAGMNWTEPHIDARQGMDNATYNVTVDVPRILDNATVDGVPDILCKWESKGISPFQRHEQRERGWDGEVVFTDPEECNPEIVVDVPGYYLLILHGSDGDGNYGFDHVFLNVTWDNDLQRQDYLASRDQTSHGYSDVPNGRVQDVETSHRSGAADPSANDADRDGRADTTDGCPWVATEANDRDEDGIPDGCDADLDDDGVANDVDNCPQVPNAAQADSDGDGRGDVCSVDSDEDGVSDLLDNCDSVPNADQRDMDSNGVGDACDPDMDGDGVLNADDAFPLDRREWSDMDGDGIGDNADRDRDGDGFSNLIELRAGTDPGSADSVPTAAQAERAEDPYANVQANALNIPLTAGMAFVLVLVGAVLIFLLRPRRV